MLRAFRADKKHSKSAHITKESPAALFLTQNAGSCLLTPSNARWVTATAFLPSPDLWGPDIQSGNVGIPFKVNVGSKRQELSNIPGIFTFYYRLHYRILL
ncbi:hypothetical protein BRYFOR_08697 [Marvinbryantia formatexigens DSM 14469]|uniref:Uncharacterized protein n=1 Tax=Marvinbryantia formatexigens DSM 14469 TaxID=478749 RepID=C6LJ63_9FIRM|nr:hypothetical protein BRYFOR_08697 [Marvinbryantia formatexigens DSM 14469]